MFIIPQFISVISVTSLSGFISFKTFHNDIFKVSASAAISSEGSTEGGSTPKIMSCWPEDSGPPWLLAGGLPHFFTT